MIEEENLEYIQKEDDLLCDRCNKKIDFKFKFEDRGYYEQIHKKYPKFNKLCEKCYKELKIPFAEIRKNILPKDYPGIDFGNICFAIMQHYYTNFAIKWRAERK